MKDPDSSPGIEDLLKGFEGWAVGSKDTFVGEGKLVKATAAKHSENRLKFCGQANGMSSGVSTLFTAERCAGESPSITKFITSDGDGCEDDDKFVPSAQMSASEGSKTSLKAGMGAGVPSPYLQTTT